MSVETSPQAEERSAGHYVPLGWMALLVGVVCISLSVLGLLRLLPKPDFPIGGLGIALFVGGYIACFVIPPFHRRIDALERRVALLEGRGSDGSGKATETQP